MTLGVQHNIFGFEVSLNDLLVVELFNSTEDLRNKEPQCLCVENFEFFQVLKELPVFLLFSNNEEFRFVLKRIPDLGNVGFKTEEFKNVLFTAAVADLAFKGDMVLDQYFHCLNFRVEFAFH